MSPDRAEKGLSVRFNLSILECKSLVGLRYISGDYVLIYPYWNVNYFVNQLVLYLLGVLIYPYWNVNRFPMTTGRYRSGFNLSILECKFVIVSTACVTIGSFNLSILECKCWNRCIDLSTVNVLIYPYWNVNEEERQDSAYDAGFNLSILECKFSPPSSASVPNAF